MSSVKKSFIKVKTNLDISKKHPIWTFVFLLRVGRKDIKRKNKDGNKVDLRFAECTDV